MFKLISASCCNNNIITADRYIFRSNFINGYLPGGGAFNKNALNKTHLYKYFHTRKK